MTIEEAIDVIDISPAYIGLEGVNKGCSYDEWNSAVSIAIEALKEIRQDYIDDRTYYEALTLAIELMEVE